MCGKISRVKILYSFDYKKGLFSQEKYSFKKNATKVYYIIVYHTKRN